jgi:flagellar biogenesis protein FliO
MANGIVTPSPAVTKFGSLLIVFLVALAAIWAVNNFQALSNITQKKAA